MEASSLPGTPLAEAVIFAEPDWELADQTAARLGRITSWLVQQRNAEIVANWARTMADETERMAPTALNKQRIAAYLALAALCQPSGIDLAAKTAS
jgi:hypothetical protein